MLVKKALYREVAFETYTCKFVCRFNLVEEQPHHYISVLQSNIKKRSIELGLKGVL